MNYLLQAKSENPLFQEMHELSVASFRANLVGEWEVFWLEWPTSGLLMPSMADWAAIYRIHFQTLHDLWKQGHNVLSTDGDTLCMKPCEIFGKYDQFRMFWATDAPYQDKWPHYLNAGVMYFPAEMKAETWERGSKELEQLRTDWDHIQQIYNDMFWSQSPVPPLDGRLNFSPCVPNPNHADDCIIWHFHSSKGANGTLDRMREMSKQMTVTA